VTQTLALAFGDCVLRPEHLVDNVARNEAEQEEDQDRNTQQRWDDRQCAFQEVGVHTVLSGAGPAWATTKWITRQGIGLRLPVAS